MDVENENTEPVADLGLNLGYSSRCIQRILSSDLGAGANAGSRIHMTYVAAEPLSELVWSSHKGPSNVTLSPPQCNTGGRSAIEKPIDEEYLLTPETSFHVKSGVTGKDMTTSPTSDAGIIPVCGSSQETGTGGNVEEVEAAVEVSVPCNQEGICSPANLQADEILETGENEIPTLSGNGDIDGADILIESDETIPFVEQNETLLGGPVDGDRHADVGNQKLEMDLVLTSEVQPLRECEASGAPVATQWPQGKSPLNKLEATAENDVENILGSESSPVVKKRSEQGEEILPGNKSVPDKDSPTNSGIHIHRRKGKEKALSDGDVNERMSKDEDDGHESVESCNSARLFSSEKKRWMSFDDEFIVGSKRFRKHIQETPICTSYIRQDSSFMNWISSMVKGFSKSIQDEVPSLALTLAQSSDGYESSDKKLIICNKNQDAGLRNIGFQSIFQSLYCPKPESQDDNHQIRGLSTEPEPATAPKACHGENVDLRRGFLLSDKKYKTSTSENEVSGEEKKGPCNFPFYKKRDRVRYSSSLAKRMKKSVENAESSQQYGRETTDHIGHRSDLLGSLWVTRFIPKTPGPSLISDHYNQSADGVVECSNDHKKAGSKEESDGDLVIVISDDLQDCGTDNEGSSAFNTNKDQNDQKSMASVFARRLDALRHIIPSGATGNAAHEIGICFFCGVKGHHIRECSEIGEKELQELLSKFKSYNGAEYFPCFCIRCSQCSHWPIACPNAPSIRQPQLERDFSCVDYYCSQSETKQSSRHEGNMKLQNGKGSSRIETDLNLSWKTKEPIAVKKMRLRPNSVKKCSASSSGENKLKENQNMPLSQFVNAQISDVPEGIFDTIKKLRLSRADVLKWMKYHTSLSQLEGFFLRLRLGKWEEGLGGTGYYVSCITGSQSESCTENVRDSIAVVVGGVRCLVKSQYVSNNDFLEDEVRAWWSATSKANGKIPSEADLTEKLKRKKMLGF